MVCSMENESIEVAVKDTIMGKKPHTIRLTPSRSIDSIFKEVSKEYNYNIDDISLKLESGEGLESFLVSTAILNTKILSCFLIVPYRSII